MSARDINDVAREEDLERVLRIFDAGGEKLQPAPDDADSSGDNGKVFQFKPRAAADTKPRPPLQWLDMSNWDDEPIPRRDWVIFNRVPAEQVGIFSGEGGAGKSIIELTKNVAHVAGKDWFGSLPELGPAIYIGTEDRQKELHIRLAAIARHYDVTFRDLIDGGLHVLPLIDDDDATPLGSLLCTVSKGGTVEPTPLYHQIYEAVADIKPINVSVDPLSSVFGGNEIDRGQVYGFRWHVMRLAKVSRCERRNGECYGGSVTILSHPSLAGIASGTGLSGSTAWHGAFRFRQYLKGVKAAEGEQPDGDLRELEFKKNQYGPIGESIVLRYRDGLFLPETAVTNLDKIAREALADEFFLSGLGQIIRQGRDAMYGDTSREFGPTLIAGLPEAKKQGLRKRELAEAMNRLLTANKIHVGRTADAPSKAKKCLVLGPKDQT